MVDLITLSYAIQDTLRDIPLLVEELDGKAEAIRAYIDLNPTANSFTNAVYAMASGEILIAWQDTNITEGEMEAWQHRFVVVVKAMKGKSDLALATVVINGKRPDADLPWRYCPVQDDVLPAVVNLISRITTNEEGIDYVVVELLIKETSDANVRS